MSNEAKVKEIESMAAEADADGHTDYAKWLGSLAAYYRDHHE